MQLFMNTKEKVKGRLLKDFFCYLLKKNLSQKINNRNIENENTITTD